MLRRPWIDETIAAISTCPGEGGIGIVRLSGEKALAAAERIFKAANGKSIASQKSFTARFGRVADASGKTVDEAILLVMRGPKSYTGEDVAEISTHGGQAVLQSVLRLSLGEGVRLAEPGEFTKRAFLNGRIDLLQAEAVLDLIRAKTDRFLSWAAAQLEGVLSKKMKKWREELVEIQSHLEAAVDFPDDFPETDSPSQMCLRLKSVLAQIRETLKDSALAILAKHGYKVVLWGKPNVGKSSLLNRLTRSERSIVTPYPGTTRDVVEEEAAIRGILVRFQDTAGIHDTDHPIEKEGIGRSKKAVMGADLVLLVIDVSRPLSEEDKALFRELTDKPAVVVLNKSDLSASFDGIEIRKHLGENVPIVSCSCVREAGVRELEEALFNIMSGGKVEMSEEATVTTTRQKDLLEKVLKELIGAEVSLSSNASPEFAAADIRHALDHLGSLVGEVVNDDILEVLFSQFCIGK